jgi:hypothetical protein
MEVVDAREYLFNIEIGNIDSEATRLLDFIPEITRIDRLMIKQCGKLAERWWDGEGEDCIP